jgi:hypothetical protein
MNRRVALSALASLVLGSRWAGAFGQEGAFHPRVLLTGARPWSDPRRTGPERWSWELVRRTSAPARLVVGHVNADEPALLSEPFVVWPGAGDVEPLTDSEIRGLRRFIEIGGVLVVDDSDPLGGAFGRGARRELARVMPESPLVKLAARRSDKAAEHVSFKSYYLLDRPYGRLEGPTEIDAIVRGRSAQVLFLEHDLLGALARHPDGAWVLPCEPGGDRQRTLAIRFAVNLAMYVLCSSYKDDQVHARALMRRRGSVRQ